MISMGTNQASIDATLQIDEASSTNWDLIVLGAGVAGSATAYWAAKLGLKVLLVEAKRFPREKVCGGCLNSRAQQMLDSIGILDDLRSAGAVPLTQIHVRVQRLGYTWNIPPLLSVRRSTLDSLLAQAAVQAGVSFLSETTGSIVSKEHESVQVRLQRTRHDENPFNVTATSKLVVLATGLTRSGLIARGTVTATTNQSTANQTIAERTTAERTNTVQKWPSMIADDSRIGVHCLISEEDWKAWFSSSQIQLGSPSRQLNMLSGSIGYVGICLSDGGQVDLAAALDPNALRVNAQSSKSNCNHAGGNKAGIPHAVAQILQECDVDVAPEFFDTKWQSTPELTRESHCVANENVFLVGDALGYIEPFTGEGMSWGLENAVKLAPLLHQALTSGDIHSAETEWAKVVQQQRKTRQTVCRWVARQARSRWKSQWVLKVFQWIPSLRNQILKKAVA
jgi:flavin-dependent dehydrogenase